MTRGDRRCDILCRMATAAVRPRAGLSEDWLTVLLGLAFILLTLAGVRPALPSFSWDGPTIGRVLSPGNLSSSLVFGAYLLLLSAAGVRIMGGRVLPYVVGFPAVFALAWLSLILEGARFVQAWGFEYVIFGLLIGLGISNTVGVPGWLAAAVRTEYYIKTGLVLMGATILFGGILRAGLFGIVQAVLVIVVIWYAAFRIAKRLHVDDEFATMLATAVSICGVSAAIAACGVIQGDRKKLSYVTSLVLLVAAPMMIVMPWAVRAFGIPDLVGGAWVGGTIDTSGAVVAAGELISEPAMNAAVIVKFSQNAMLGLAAFALSIWWTMRQGTRTGTRPSARVIWDRFPKFVLGFIATSLLFSFVLSSVLVTDTGVLIRTLRTWWFALAFVCIGLETRVGDIIGMEEGRPAAAFLIAQTLNVVWTLAIAWLLFGGVWQPATAL
jgi:uncharacterized integral membrane protein (TIGR00698 family)